MRCAKRAKSATLCDGQPSHAFDLLSLFPDDHDPARPPQPLNAPVAYGRAVYAALFPPGTPAVQALARETERIVLVATDTLVQAVPWEYAYGLDGYLVLDYAFVRGVIARPPRRVTACADTMNAWLSPYCQRIETDKRMLTNSQRSSMRRDNPFIRFSIR